MSLVQVLVDRFAPSFATSRGEQDVGPLLAKRFEQRVARLAPAERTEEGLSRLFEDVRDDLRDNLFRERARTNTR